MYFQSAQILQKPSDVSRITLHKHPTTRTDRVLVGYIEKNP